MDSKQQEKDVEFLRQAGCTEDEIRSILYLQRWYQSGGSDRVDIVKHWEFLRSLVQQGKLNP